jgi:hypothetical protein
MLADGPKGGHDRAEDQELPADDAAAGPSPRLPNGASDRSRGTSRRRPRLWRQQGHATIYRQADRAWEAQALGRLRLHRARHTYASFMIAAGVNPKARICLSQAGAILANWSNYWPTLGRNRSSKRKKGISTGLQSRLHRFDSGGPLGLRGRDLRPLALTR